VYPDEATASAAAGAKLAALQRGSETVELVIVGNPKVGSGCQVKLSGFRSGVDRTWIVTRATHKISEAGYTSEIEGVKK
jgi:hypothetical protein